MARENARRYREKNRDLIRERQCASRASDPDRFARYAKDAYLRNAEKVKQRATQYRKANRDKARAWRLNAKIRRKRAEGSHSAADIQAILRRQDDLCVYCKIHLSDVRWHVDHIKPLSKGGTNWPNNLQILCPPCNRSKSDTEPDVFAARRLK